MYEGKLFEISCRGGLVGYDAAFTRLRSRVEFPAPVKWCDSVAEWLRRWIANPLLFERASSNLATVVIMNLYGMLECQCTCPPRLGQSHFGSICGIFSQVKCQPTSMLVLGHGSECGTLRYKLSSLHVWWRQFSNRTSTLVSAWAILAANMALFSQ